MLELERRVAGEVVVEMPTTPAPARGRRWGLLAIAVVLPVLVSVASLANSGIAYRQMRALEAISSACAKAPTGIAPR